MESDLLLYEIDWNILCAPPREGEFLKAIRLMVVVYIQVYRQTIRVRAFRQAYVSLSGKKSLAVYVIKNLQLRS